MLLEGPDQPRRWRGAVPIYGSSGGVIGTGAVVGPKLVLTALHVVDPEPTRKLRVGPGLSVSSAIGLPLRGFRDARDTAQRSYDRFRAFTGLDIGSVDLAMLVVPELDVMPLTIRRTPVCNGEHITVAGYPIGRRTVTVGPVTSHDDADFVAHLLLGPGSSGSPALDSDGQLIGINTMDHMSAGGIFIGPGLLAHFAERTAQLLARQLRKHAPAGELPAI